MCAMLNVELTSKKYWKFWLAVSNVELREQITIISVVLHTLYFCEVGLWLL